MAGRERVVHVLVVEDSPQDAAAVERLLAEATDETFVVETAPTLAEALVRLDAPAPVDIALVDLWLPDARGIEGPRQVLAHPRALPVVVLTGADDSAIGETIVAVGAQDYLVKSRLDGDTLARVIRYSLTRAAELASLRRQLTDLQAVNDELVRYAARVAHDLKGPMTTVGGLSDVLALPGLDDASEIEVRSRLSVLARRASAMVDEMLRDAMGALQRTRTDLKEVVASVTDMLHADLQASHAHVDVGALPVVECNAAMVRRVLLALVANALQFRDPQRQPVIRIDGRRVDDRWEITVADNGVGIEPARRSELLRPSPTGSPGHGDEGLGLPSVRTSIARLGGVLRIEDSPLGHGVAFTFTLPA